MGWQPETQPKGKPPVEKTKGAETMQRLIDADAIEFPDANYWEETHEDEDYGYGMGVGDCIEIIEKMPTIDAVPVRHGKWTVTPIYIKCSECGESFMLIPQNYCPNCGCRMDEE